MVLATLLRFRGRTSTDLPAAQGSEESTPLPIAPPIAPPIVTPRSGHSTVGSQSMAMDAAEEAIHRLLESAYGLRGNLSCLGGTGDNYLLETDSGERFVFKLLGPEEDAEGIEVEDAAIRAIGESSCQLEVPHIVRTHSRDLVAVASVDRNGHCLRGRLLRFVSGRMWRESLPASVERYRQLGRTLGVFSMELLKVHHPSARRTHSWAPARASEWRDRAVAIQLASRQRMIGEVFDQFAHLASPVLHSLQHGLIHSDLNDENLMVVDGRVTGVIDFSDSLWQPVVCELGVALAYLLLDEPQEPWAAGAALIGAYHRVRPLSGAEIDVIYPLMLSRLAVSVISSAERRLEDPNRAEWFATEERAWAALERWLRMSPGEAGGQLAAEID